MTPRPRIVHQDHRGDGDAAENVKRNDPPGSRCVRSREHARNRRRNRFRGGDERIPPLAAILQQHGKCRNAGGGLECTAIRKSEKTIRCVYDVSQ